MADDSLMAPRKLNDWFARQLWRQMCLRLGLAVMFFGLACGLLLLLTSGVAYLSLFAFPSLGVSLIFWLSFLVTRRRRLEVLSRDWKSASPQFAAFKSLSQPRGETESASQQLRPT